MLRTEKAEAINEIKERFGRSSSAVFVEFTGMTVDEVSRLRVKLREKGVDYSQGYYHGKPRPVTEEFVKVKGRLEVAR